MTGACPVWDPLFSRNFQQVVLGCIDISDSESGRIVQHFSRSKRFAFFCTAANSKVQQNIVTSVGYFYMYCKFRKLFCEIVIDFIVFRTDADETVSEFHEIILF